MRREKAKDLFYSLSFVNKSIMSVVTGINLFRLVIFTQSTRKNG